MLEGTQKVHFPTCMCSCHRNLSWKYSFPAALQFRISRKSSNLSERLCLDSCVPLVCLSKPTLISQSPFRPRVCSSSSRLSWLFLALFRFHINFRKYLVNLNTHTLTDKKTLLELRLGWIKCINLGRNDIFITEFSNLWI